MTILHLERSEFFRKIVKEIVLQSGMQYVGVPSGKEGLTMLDLQKIDVIITGIELADGSGKSFLQQLQDTPFRTIPTIVVTSDESLEVRQALYSMGIVDYIRKSDLTQEHLSRYLFNLTTESEWVKYLRTMDIALLDDSRTGQAVIVNMLELNRVTKVDVFSHPAELLAKKKSYGLYLVDLVLPGMSGEEVILKLRDQHPHAVIIAVSGVSNTTTVSHVLLSGADDYLTKPFDVKIFMARIRANVRTYQLLAELEQKKQELQLLADTDSMTGLYNHRYMFNFLDLLIEKSRKSSRNFGVLLMDLDNFKSINDTHGHPVGDQVICQFAQRITDQFGKKAVCGRYGGEEFMVLLPDIKPGVLKQSGSTLLETMRSSTVSDKGLTVHFSGGALVWDGKTGANELVSRVDKLLYAAKTGGKNQIQYGET